MLMLETRILQLVPEIVALLPMIATIYKVYFGRAKPYNEESIMSITKTAGEIIPIGSNDVAPPGSTKNYTLEVKVGGTGTLQVTHPDNKDSQILSVDNDVKSNFHEFRGPNQQTLLITESDDQGQSLLFGALVYKP